MYNEIKNLTKTFQPRLGVIKDENGKTLKESEKIADRWKNTVKKCIQMAKQQTRPQHTDKEEEEEEEEKEEEEEEEANLPPLKTEIEWAIKSLKDGKSPGYDIIQAEMIKASGEEGADVYHKLCINNNNNNNRLF